MQERLLPSWTPLQPADGRYVQFEVCIPTCDQGICAVAAVAINGLGRQMPSILLLMPDILSLFTDH